MTCGNRASLLVAVFLGLFGWGCAASPVIQGKVIEGNLSFIAVVDQSDERLQKEGLGEVSIEARTGSARGGNATLAGTDSKPDGAFTLKFKEQSVLTRPVEFVAEKAGYQPAKVEMIKPAPGRQLLIILTPVGKARSGEK